VLDVPYSKDDESPAERQRSVRVAFDSADPVEVDVVPSFATGSVSHATRIGHLPRNTTRICGYSRCGNTLVYDGNGRPPEYCKDRHWPGGKTCRQMAQAERDAVRAAGLDAHLDAFDSTAGQLVTVAGPLHERLGDLLAALDHVRDGALTRVGDAERQMAEAVQRADRAERHAQRATAEEHRARTEMEQASAAAQHAAVQAAEARQDADTRIAAALDRLTIVEREHGQALARAHAAEAARHDEAERRTAAEQRAADLDAHLHQARETIERTREAHDALRERADAAEQAANRVQAELLQVTTRAEQAEMLAATQATELDDTRTRLTGERDAAESRADAATQALAAARSKHEQLRRQLAEATIAELAATKRAERAETRHDRLVETLSNLAHRNASSEGDPA
jgi:chromosome segregation ATPase